MVLDNGQVHSLRMGKLPSEDHCDMDWSESFSITGHKIQSIASGFYHNVIVTTRGAIFGFGLNNKQQLGVVDPSALVVLEPTELFAAVTKFK